MDPKPELSEAAAQGLPETALPPRQAHANKPRAEEWGCSLPVRPQAVTSLRLLGPQVKLDLPLEALTKSRDFTEGLVGARGWRLQSTPESEAS